MFFQYHWLLSLLFLASTIASADAKKSSTTTSATHVSTSSNKPTTSSIPTSASPVISTALPDPTSTSFYLVVADTGTPFDGDYLHLGQAFAGDGLFVLLFTPDLDLAGTFSLSNGTYGYLVDNASQEVATYYDLYGGIIFGVPGLVGAEGGPEVECELADGAILCQNTEYAAFYTYPSSVVNGQSTVPYLELGPVPVPSGSVQLTLLPVPIN